MKRLLFLTSLLFLFFVDAHSQIMTKQDSIKAVDDSIALLHKKIHDLAQLKHQLDGTSPVRRRGKVFADEKNDSVPAIREAARRVIGSLFGESRQLSNADSLLRAFDNQPSFGMYKDNYVITGTEAFSRTNRWNSDCKFQVSIRQRLTNSTLPFNTHIYLTYTQKAFWDIYRESFPFRDLNFNPTIGIGRPLIHNNRLLGTIGLEFEHESNGKDQDASRSWNKISANSLFVFRDRWVFQSKLWIPIVDGDSNPDITQYMGYGFAALTYSSLQRKYNISCVVTKRAGAFFDANVMLNFSVRMFSNEDIYLYVEYYDGYGESMLDYKEYRQRIRAGISIKTNMFSIF
ncbi:phospholipase A [Dysgonomonas sp. 25]|uniref:phospholipase A n=1 Tax=Dysgonomonas sp. 25 TaxID=2302933 RepID=UPI0013CFFC36|nr:phospholipase A [Dysgonomonas sp. 25]NDV69051.1 phospholipase [Dysgonomonas sp. 25]